MPIQDTDKETILVADKIAWEGIKQIGNATQRICSNTQDYSSVIGDNQSLKTFFFLTSQISAIN